MKIRLPDKDTWVTKEGQYLDIKVMASSHLLATIHYIERNRFTNSVDCAMRQFQNVEESEGDSLDVEYYLQWPVQYEALVVEAQRRSLINRAAPEIVKTSKLQKRGR